MFAFGCARHRAETAALLQSEMRGSQRVKLGFSRNAPRVISEMRPGLGSDLRRMDVMRTAASLIALLTSFAASAQDFPDEPPRLPSKASPANRSPGVKIPDPDEPLKSPAKPTNATGAKCPDGPPEAILKFMADSLQVTADETNPAEVRSAFRGAFNSILSASEKVVRHASASEAQKNEAYQYQASIFYQGARKGELDYADRLDQLAKTLFRSQPRTDVANLAHFLSVKARYEEEEGLRSEAIPAIDDYLKKFPREEAAIELLLDAATHAEGNGRNSVAKDALAIVERNFKRHEVTSKIPAIQKRLELVGKKLSVELALMNGKKFSLDDPKRRIVVVNFWATWCQPCLAEQEILKDLYSRYKSEGLEIVGIPLDEKESAVQLFLSKHQVTWPQAVIPFEPSAQGFNHPFAKQYGVMQAPTTFLIDEGKVVATQIRGQALRKKVEDLIGKSGSNSKLTDRLGEPPAFK